MSDTRHILVVDDHFETLELLRYMLELTSHEYRVLGVPSAEEGLLEIRRRPYDLLITDVNLPGMSGFELVRKVLSHNPDLPIIVISGLASNQIQDEAGELAIFRYFRKPLDTDAFIEAVQRALHEPVVIQDNMHEPVEENLQLSLPSDVSRRLENLRTDTGAKQILLSSFDGELSVTVGGGNDLELQQLTAGIAAQVSSSFFLAEEIGSAEPISIHYQASRRYDLYSANVGRDYFLAILFDAHIRRGRIGTVWVFAQRAVGDLKSLLPERPLLDGQQAVEAGLPVTAKLDPDSLSATVDESEKIDEQLREIDEPLTLGEIEELLGESDSLTTEELDLDLSWDEALAEDSDSTISSGISIEEARQQGLIPSDFDPDSQ
jgi:CheY-like chemotaxis protein